MADQEREVLRTIAQGGQIDPVGEAVEKVLPEPPFPQPLVEVDVRGDDDPCVGRPHLVGAERAEFLLLDEAEQLDLEAE